MVFFSKQPSTINLNVHSPDPKHEPGANTSWVAAVDLPQGFHEYRFDWMPDRIDFYFDSVLAWTTTENIPDTPGKLMLSHLSNGVPDWSGGPPVEDAVMTVMYVKAYYNTTSSRDEPNLDCSVVRADTVCVVPDQASPLEPKRKTHFYSLWREEHKNDDNTFKASGSDAKSDHSSAASFGMSSLVWAFVGAVCSVVYCLT
jgi:beta-glucanase (GH16 family)